MNYLKKWKNYNSFIEISDQGDVCSHGKLLTGETTKNGYVRVHPVIDGKQKHLLVHRIVAEVFIPNPNNLPIVNHIDGNKQTLLFLIRITSHRLIIKMEIKETML